MTSGAGNSRFTHVARRAAGVRAVLGFHEASNTEISESEVAVLLEDQVLRFEVSMDDLPVVNILQRHHDAGHEEPYLAEAYWWCSRRRSAAGRCGTAGPRP